MMYQIAKIKLTCACKLSEKYTLVAFSISFPLVNPSQTYSLFREFKPGTCPSMKGTFDYYETNTETYYNSWK